MYIALSCSGSTLAVCNYQYCGTGVKQVNGMLLSFSQTILASDYLEPKTRFCYCLTVEGILMSDALSNERKGLSYTVAVGPHHHSHCQFQRAHDHTLLSPFRDSPTWGGGAKSLYLYPYKTGWPSYTPRLCVPFFLPPVTCGAMLLIFRLSTPVPSIGHLFLLHYSSFQP
jgi:hypothetical protein